MGLANIWCSSPCELDEFLLRDFPNILIDVLKFVWESLDFLNGSLVCYQLVSSLSIPESKLYHVFDKMWVDAHELTSEDSSRVDICCIWLKTLIVSHDLGS